MKSRLIDQVAKGVAWSTAEKVCSMLLQMVVSIVVARLLVPEDFGKRLNIELWNFYCPYGKSMTDLMELHLFKTVLFEKAGKELSVSSRFCGFCFACQKEVVWVLCVKLLDDVHK